MTKTVTNKKSNLSSWIIFVALAAGLAVIAATHWNKNMTIQEVVISGTYFTDVEAVHEIANAAIGIQPDSLDLNVLINEIGKLSYVKSVIPFVEPNGKFRLQISEREPIALLINNSKRAYVDSDGIILQIVDNKIQNVPLLYGFDISSTDTLNHPAYIEISDFLIAAKSNEFGWVTISELAFNADEGVVALSHENGVKLVFGKGDFETKLQNWEAFYAQVIKTKGIDALHKVDLRYTNQVVTNEI